jgi:hypothetical protein
VADAEGDAVVVASYVTDGPEQFITAVARVVLGASQARAEFEAEPIVYRWLFDRDNGHVQIRLLQLPSRGSRDDVGDIVWASRQPVDVVARAVVRAFDAVETEHGEVGYQAMWGRPFPSFELRALHDAWRGSLGNRSRRGSIG